METLAGRMAWERIIQAISTGINPKASDFKVWAESEQGWHRQETSNGPLKYIDNNGVARLTLKQGSPRTPGSNDPHVELKNANNIRIDLQGKPVTRKSKDNHTPIDWDI
ncbi:MAG: hypothetical protein WBA89_09670 [Microcoleus sp.]|uniref:hypothetical protein n=1 Tax=unclassified Microcoleus TaxID=2642155 RepID=UPI002FCE6AF5